MAQASSLPSRLDKGKSASISEKADLAQVELLLEELFACDLPYCDPEGEPTLIQIALMELARKFGKLFVAAQNRNSSPSNCVEWFTDASFSPFLRRWVRMLQALLHQGVFFSKKSTTECVNLK